MNVYWFLNRSSSTIRQSSLKPLHSRNNLPHPPLQLLEWVLLPHHTRIILHTYRTPEQELDKLFHLPIHLLRPSSPEPNPCMGDDGVDCLNVFYRIDVLQQHTHAPDRLCAG